MEGRVLWEELQPGIEKEMCDRLRCKLSVKPKDLLAIRYDKPYKLPENKK
jgi:hypothetical protein